MKTEHIVIGLVAVALLTRRRRPVPSGVPAQTQADYLNDPTTWGADQWARLYGADMLRTDAQSGHTAYQSKAEVSLQFSGFPVVPETWNATPEWTPTR